MQVHNCPWYSHSIELYLSELVVTQSFFTDVRLEVRSQLDRALSCDALLPHTLTHVSPQLSMVLSFH